jgi:hypothetical protein
MKNPQRHVPLGGSLIVITLWILAAPTAQALSPPNPSGDYLDMQTGNVWLYDNTTGTLTQTNLPNPTYTCYTNQAPSQCGNCTYVPNDGNKLGDKKGWEDATSTYTYGACANLDLDITNGTSALVRGDVKVLSNAADNWYVNVTVQYSLYGNPAWTSYPVYNHQNFVCSHDLTTSNCKDTPHGWNPLDARYAPPPGTLFNSFCVQTTVFNDVNKNPNPTLIDQAWACTGNLGIL